MKFGKFGRWAWQGLVVAAWILGARSAAADGRNPGSLLIYPEFDNSAGRATLLTVTNTNSDPDSGSVRVEFVYINGSGPDSSLCLETNFTEVLTPNDTLTVVTGMHSPNLQRGYVYVFAKDAQNRAIAFDWLIGEAMLLSGELAFEYSFNAVTFTAAVPAGALTDVDLDGIRDLDGAEYEQAPARIYIPRFLGQSAVHQSDLILIGLTGGRQFTTLLNFLIYNDNEEIFSSHHSFRCWQKVPLLTISNLFEQTFLANFTNDDPAEIVGFPSIEAGWMEIDGGIANSTATSILDPAFLAVLVERTAGTPRSGSELAFETGKQNNGDLLPVSLLGDGP